jgi:MFS family permease
VAALVFAGLAWMAVTSTLAAQLQLFLRVWVRARGLAVYMVMFTGSMTAGELLWGLVAEAVGLQATFLAAAVVLLVGVVAGLLWRVPETAHLQPPSCKQSCDPPSSSSTYADTATMPRRRPWLVRSDRRWVFRFADAAEWAVPERN